MKQDFDLVEVLDNQIKQGGIDIKKLSRLEIMLLVRSVPILIAEIKELRAEIAEIAEREWLDYIDSYARRDWEE